MMDYRSMLRRVVFAGLAILTVLLSATAIAKTTGVGEDLALQSGPCYQALVDKNAETPTTAPNRELGSACQAENGDINKAWARVQRLWGSDSADLPDYDSYRPADAPVAGSTPLWLAIAAIVLLYAIVATPLRPLARLMGGQPNKGRLAGEVVAALILRASVAFGFLALFNLPVLALIGEIALIVLLLYGILDRQHTRSNSTNAESTGATAHFIANVLNDSAGGGIGLIGLALMSNHNPILLGSALILALILSIPTLVAARRILKLKPLARTATTALLAGAIALFIVNEPTVVSLANGATYLGIALPIVVAAVVIATAWRRWGRDMLSPTARLAVG